jgi:hypothetical protein
MHLRRHLHRQWHCIPRQKIRWIYK